MVEKQEETEKILTTIIKGIQDLKGKDIVQIDLTTINHTECNFFLICHGTSNTHVNSIAESVEEVTKEELGLKAFHKEGYTNGIWILLDYGEIIVHVFKKEARDFYDLEKLWADAKLTTIQDVEN